MFEKKFDFLELFCLLIMEFYFKKGNFEDNFSAKIKVSGWTKTNMAAASHHPRILSPKYWQAGNVKRLTANRSLLFAVKWPNLDLKVSTVTGGTFRPTRRIRLSFVEGAHLDLRDLYLLGNSMICSDIWHKYHEWYFEIVIHNFTSR